MPKEPFDTTLATAQPIALGVPRPAPAPPPARAPELSEKRRREKALINAVEQEIDMIRNERRRQAMAGQLRPTFYGAGPYPKQTVEPEPEPPSP